MDFIRDFSQLSNIFDLVLAVVIFGVIIFFTFKFKYSRFAIITGIISMVVVIITWLFKLNLCYIISIFVTALIEFIFAVFYLPNIKTYFKGFGNKVVANKKDKSTKIVDHEALYNEIYKTVSICSKNKIGALITFERNDDLIPLTKNGTRVDAPVTHELLTTIFYPGTRLHDGAVIIKDGMVYAASVYYTPTTRALKGKYGSRHRAALGISEISDSITVVVSEETGRISIAKAGELEVVDLENFVRELEDSIAD